MVAGPAEIEKYAAEHIPPAAFILAAGSTRPAHARAGGEKGRCPLHLVRAGKDTLDCAARRTRSRFRCSSAPGSCRAFGIPFGAPSPTTAQQVLAYFDGQIEGVIDGGECTLSRESTILALTQKP